MKISNGLTGNEQATPDDGGTSKAPVEARASQGSRLRHLTWRGLQKGASSQQMGLIAALLIFSVAISLRNHNYYGEENLIEILRSSVYIFIIGIISTYVFISGGLDLSVGSVYALGSISCAMEIGRAHV